MNVCLIDVDSKIPNLALMKASTYHKQIGDTVKLGYDPLFDNPDLCYVSKMFSFTQEPKNLPDCKILRGGPAYSLTTRMPFDDGSGSYDRICPDYELYKDKFPKANYALGRFTRGCPNRCPWCVVWHMDGNEVRKVADLSDFWRGQDTVRLLDDNIMADENILCDACEQLHDAGVKVIWEALDIRLVTDVTAAALATVKYGNKRLHFAWDSHVQDDYIECGIETLKRNGIKPWRLMFYILVGFNTTPEYDMHRILTISDAGADPYVMPYNHDMSNPYVKHLTRWCNNKIIFRKTSFDNYEPWVKHKMSSEYNCEQ